MEYRLVYPFLNRDSRVRAKSANLLWKRDYRNLTCLSVLFQRELYRSCTGSNLLTVLRLLAEGFQEVVSTLLGVMR
jgi:hypothetical protein